MRLQRQIALKNFKAALEPCGQGLGDISVAFEVDLGLTTSARTTCSNGFSPTRVSQPWEELCIAVEETSQVNPLNSFQFIIMHLVYLLIIHMLDNLEQNPPFLEYQIPKSIYAI